MPENRPNDEAPRLRIALCHLESLVCLPGLNVLFGEMGEQIGLVILSRRFGARYGGLFTQLRRGIRRSGWRMTVWLGFDIVSAQIMSAVASATAPILGRESPLQSVRALASRHGAKVVEVGDVNDAETIATMAAYAPNLVIVFNFDQILKPGVIATAATAVINVHPSNLPSFRGPCPVFWALAKGCREVGVSIHAITDGEIDAGPVLRQERTSIDPAQSVAEITSALFLAGARLVPGVVRELLEGRLRPSQRIPSPNDDQCDYYSFPDPGDVASAIGRGIRLCHARPILRLMAAAIGRRVRLT
ncbi:MAG: methionyl-tRNA formyltransferase [Xanthobacteraceae bacterium]|nr:MAG: methionyl-tRNA formyltransferase [Xanthobacteraceae bacterium]